MVCFFYHDSGRLERQSIGVYLVKDARGTVTEPIFYCPEWFIFWVGIDKLSQGIERSKNLEKMSLEPLSLKEIIDYNLSDYMSGVLDTGSQYLQATGHEKVILF